MTTRLIVGQPAPEFSLSSSDGRATSLGDLRGRKVIVYFYPAALTPGCTTQACDFRDADQRLLDAGYVVVGISPDPLPKLEKFATHNHLKFPLLSDPDHKVMEAYGVWGEKTMYGRTSIGVIRSTFVVDEQGNIEHALYAVKAKGHVERLLTLLSA